MEIHISGHQMDVTSALRDHVNNKLEKVVRHFDHVLDINVVLGVEKLLHKAEATIKVSGKTMHADHESHDMYVAIDGLIDKLDAQVRKYKEKIQSKHRQEVRQQRAEPI